VNQREGEQKRKKRTREAALTISPDIWCRNKQREKKKQEDKGEKLKESTFLSFDFIIEEFFYRD